MPPTTSPVRRWALVAVLCALLVAAAVTIPAVTSSGAPGYLPQPAVPGSDYLALGDSVTFGYREPNSVPAPDYPDPSSFTGYPADVGAALGLKVTNAACEGETTASFINVAAQSNGCEHTDTGGPGYRSSYPLHVAYTGSQLDFAVSWLKAHPDTRLVSLLIGGNDAGICIAMTSDSCTTEWPALLNEIGHNVGIILTALRERGGYSGQIVLLDYSSVDSANTDNNELAQDINQAAEAAAEPFHVEVANGYRAFRLASEQAGGSTCDAGLLTHLDTGGCGAHPSLTGQAMLALSVEDAVKK